MLFKVMWEFSGPLCRQDSLGGNTKTLMVACLSPADNNYEETVSTLRYANRAKNIKNKPKINEDPKDAQLREYQEEIQKLRDMLDKKGPAVPGVAGAEHEGENCAAHFLINEAIFLVEFMSAANSFYGTIL